MNLRRRLRCPKPSRRPIAFFAPLAFAAVLAGCVTTPPPVVAPPPVPVVQRETGPVLGRDDDFAVVIVQPGEDLTVLAKRYLGDRSKAWWIAELDGAETARPGQVIAVPLRPRNAPGVHANGYQTVPILTCHRFGSMGNKLTVTPIAFEDPRQSSIG